MSIMQNLLKITLFTSLVLLFAVSCKKDLTNDLPTTETTGNVTNQGTSKFIGGDHNGDEFDSLCFEIVYPVTVLLPGGNDQTAMSDDELFTIIDDWYMNNPDSDDDPTLAFPIDVNLPDGTTQSLTGEEELEELFEGCFDEEWEECFTINFPVTVVYPDGTTASAASEDELETLFDDWEMNNPNSTEYPTLAFPIEITLEDGSTQSIADEDELEALFEECDEYWDEYGEYDDEFDLCFEIVYPINVLFPDGSTQTANDDEELDDIIFTWFETAPDSADFPTLEFPIQVDLEGEIITVIDEEELEELFEECEDEWDDEGNPFEECFSITYPITVVFPDATTTDVNSDEELENAIDGWYDQNPDSDDDPTLAYPIEVTLIENGAVVTVNSDEELEEIIEECFDCLISNSNQLTSGNDNTTVAAMVIKRHTSVERAQQAKIAKAFGSLNK